MPRHLFSARAKLLWARKKARALDLEIRAYRGRDPHRIAVEHDAALGSSTLILKVLEEMPVISWGLQIGDCLYSLRSSLDHALLEVAARRQGTWPNPPSDEGKLQFPICDEGKFSSALWHLGEMRHDQTVRTCIEKLQPYNRPVPYLLSLLRDLNDRDKHRFISVVRARTQQMNLTIRNDSGQTLRPIMTLFAPPLDGNAKILSFRFDPPRDDVYVQGEPKFVFYPALHEPISLEAKLQNQHETLAISPLLEGIRLEVRHCLSELQTLV